MRASGRSVHHFNEISNSLEMPAVTAFLRSRIQPGDPILVTLVSSISVHHYFRKAGIPLEALSLRKLDSGHLFAIEDKLPL